MDDEAVINSYYTPLNELDAEELTNRWMIFNETDAFGNHLISDNYYSLLNGSTLNYDKSTMDRIFADLIDSKVPREEDMVPEAFSDYEDLNICNELRRQKRLVASEDTTILPIAKVAKAVLRHFEANKEGVVLARAAIETAGAINKALVSSREWTPDKMAMVKAAVDVAGALDRGIRFVDDLISNSEALDKALKETWVTGQDIDAMYAAANAGTITTMT